LSVVKVKTLVGDQNKAAFMLTSVDKSEILSSGGTMRLFDSYVTVTADGADAQAWRELSLTELRLVLCYIIPNLLQTNCFRVTSPRVMAEDIGLYAHQYKAAMLSLEEKGWIARGGKREWMLDPHIIYAGSKHRQVGAISKWIMLTSEGANADSKDGNAGGDQKTQAGSLDLGGDHAEGAGGCGLPAESGFDHEGPDEEDLSGEWAGTPEESGDGTNLPTDDGRLVVNGCLLRSRDAVYARRAGVDEV
jgi:hypothetical protein